MRTTNTPKVRRSLTIDKGLDRQLRKTKDINASQVAEKALWDAVQRGRTPRTLDEARAAVQREATALEVTRTRLGYYKELVAQMEKDGLATVRATIVELEHTLLTCQEKNNPLPIRLVCKLCKTAGITFEQFEQELKKTLPEGYAAWETLKPIHNTLCIQRGDINNMVDDWENIEREFEHVHLGITE